MARRRCKPSPTRRLNLPEQLRSDRGSGTASPCDTRSATASATTSTSPCKAAAWESASHDSEGSSAHVATNSPSSTDQVTRVGVAGHVWPLDRLHHVASFLFIAARDLPLLVGLGLTVAVLNVHAPVAGPRDLEHRIRPTRTTRRTEAVFADFGEKWRKFSGFSRICVFVGVVDDHDSMG